MTKTKKMILIIVSIILFLAIAAWFLVPRILVYIGVKTFDTIEEISVSTVSAETIANAEYGEMQRIEADGISLEIPADFVQKELDNPDIGLVIYHSPMREDKSYAHSIMVLTPTDMSDLNFLQEGVFNSDTGVEMSQEQLQKGFEAMGGPLPDSAYNTYKRTYLLTEDDYSFWNLNQGAAYLAASALRSVTLTYDRAELFETDNICGFINFSDEKGSCIAEIYSKDDLNTVHTLITDTDLIYTVLDSVEIVK